MEPAPLSSLPRVAHFGQALSALSQLGDRHDDTNTMLTEKKTVVPPSLIEQFLSGMDQHIEEVRSKPQLYEKAARGLFKVMESEENVSLQRRMLNVHRKIFEKLTETPSSSAYESTKSYLGEAFLSGDMERLFKYMIQNEKDERGYKTMIHACQVAKDINRSKPQQSKNGNAPHNKNMQVAVEKFKNEVLSQFLLSSRIAQQGQILTEMLVQLTANPKEFMYAERLLKALQTFPGANYFTLESVDMLMRIIKNERICQASLNFLTAAKKAREENLKQLRSGVPIDMHEKYNVDALELNSTVINEFAKIAPLSTGEKLYSYPASQEGLSSLFTEFQNHILERAYPINIQSVTDIFGTGIKTEAPTEEGEAKRHLSHLSALQNSLALWTPEEQELIKQGYVTRNSHGVWQKGKWKLLESTPLEEGRILFKKGNLVFNFATPNTKLTEDKELPLDLSFFEDLNYDHCQTVFNFILSCLKRNPAESFVEYIEEERKLLQKPDRTEGGELTHPEKPTQFMTSEQYNTLSRILFHFSTQLTLEYQKALLFL